MVTTTEVSEQDTLTCSLLGGKGPLHNVFLKFSLFEQKVLNSKLPRVRDGC